MFAVEEVIVHYKYKILELQPRSEENGRDLALVRLDRDAMSEGLEPLCLPPGRRFPDDSGILKGYTEGWGTDTDTSGQCITSQEGPAPFQPCQARTIIPTRDGRPPKIYKGCVKGKSPTSLLIKEYKAGLCARLKAHLRRQKEVERHLMIPGVSELVVVTQSEVERRCYHENRFGWERREAGWCATCREEAEPGEYGYCGQESQNKTTEQTLNRTSNWGFCLQSAACTRSGTSTAQSNLSLRMSNGFKPGRMRLQEIYLDILTAEQCKQFTTEINTVRELCAGKKIYPHIRVYLAREDQVGGQSFQELSVEEEEEEDKEEDMETKGIVPSVLMRSNDSERDWALGGGDTCQGDSGGPLIKWLGGVGVMIGVVSRGTRCGRLDSAGIYIRQERDLADTQSPLYLDLSRGDTRPGLLNTLSRVKVTPPSSPASLRSLLPDGSQVDILLRQPRKVWGIDPTFRLQGTGGQSGGSGVGGSDQSNFLSDREEEGHSWRRYLIHQDTPCWASGLFLPL